MENQSRLRGLIRLVYGLLIAVALLGPSVFWQSGLLEREATTFIRQYSIDRPLLQKVFDPHTNDLGTYQARELSYFLDSIDASFYEFVARRTHRPLFVPLSALLASLLFAVIFLAGVRRVAPHVDFVTGAVLLVCFLTSFCFLSTKGVFYRSGKPVLSVVLLAWLFHTHLVARRRLQAGAVGRANGRDSSVAFALALVAGLLDRQGFFYVLTASFILFIHVRLTGELKDLLRATIAAAIILTVYNLVLAPVLIGYLNGYWPDFSYQRLPMSELVRPQVHLSRGIRLLFMNVAMLTGGFTLVSVAVATSTALLAWRRFGAPVNLRLRYDMIRSLIHDRQGRVLTYGFLIVLFQLGMFALMVARHSPIFKSVDHRYWNVPLPFLTTVFYGVLMIVNGAMARLPAGERRSVALILGVVALGNVFSAGSYREAMTNGPYFGPVYQQSEMLKASIISGVADPRLEPAYRVFFDYDHRLRPRR